MRAFTSLALVTLAACGGDDGVDVPDPELITTVRLHLVPQGGGTTVDVAFDDADGDGGNPPTIDPIVLVKEKLYTVTVQFQNALETPPEEITDEVRDEGEDHQVFFTGSGVNGPASDEPNAPLVHAYADTDSNGLPIGLENTFGTAEGTGQLTVTLRHLPPVNGTAVKTADLASQVKNAGFAAIGGENDVNVTFSVTVQ
jgi:hypothetical protein